MNRKNKNYIYAGLSFLLIAVMIGIFYFAYTQIYKLKNDISLKKEEWKKEEDRRNDIKNLEKSVKNLVNERNLLNSHFVYKSDPVAFLNDLEDMASSVGAKAEISTVGVGDQDKFLLVDLKLEGSFDAVYRYLNLIENSQYEMEISNLDIASSLKEASLLNSQNTSVWSLSMRIKLLSFVKN